MKAAMKNDVIGLRKDIATDENANTILHRIKQTKATEEKAIYDVMKRHNELITDYVYLKQKLFKQFENHAGLLALKNYIEFIEKYEYGAVFCQLQSPRYTKFNQCFQLVNLKFK